MFRLGSRANKKGSIGALWGAKCRARKAILDAQEEVGWKDSVAF